MSGLSLGTLVSNLKSVALTVFELLAFNTHWPAAAHTQTDKHTHIERTHYLRHSLRSLGGDNETMCQCWLISTCCSSVIRCLMDHHLILPRTVPDCPENLLSMHCLLLCSHSVEQTAGWSCTVSIITVIISHNFPPSTSKSEIMVLYKLFVLYC